MRAGAAEVGGQWQDACTGGLHACGHGAGDEGAIELDVEARRRREPGEEPRVRRAGVCGRVPAVAPCHPPRAQAAQRPRTPRVRPDPGQPTMHPLGARTDLLPNHSPRAPFVRDASRKNIRGAPSVGPRWHNSGHAPVVACRAAAGERGTGVGRGRGSWGKIGVRTWRWPGVCDSRREARRARAHIETNSESDSRLNLSSSPGHRRPPSRYHSLMPVLC